MSQKTIEKSSICVTENTLIIVVATFLVLCFWERQIIIESLKCCEKLKLILPIQIDGSKFKRVLFSWILNILQSPHVLELVK